MIDVCTSTKGVTCGLYSSHEEYKWIFGSFLILFLVVFHLLSTKLCGVVLT
jgi:hypothetical protein